ncbi:unnamed protein product [Linum tenue]|uniref:Cysteine alpha-hairpin motif superfamily n=1 Tax=Linum tenue TaxID=586396 RepID=A0AAV0M4U3_9ROSI|nr:unnamed protein product [Linum tenue]
MEKAVAVCGQAAVDLLNCVAESPYDNDKCLRLLQALRDCAVKQNVKKFSLANEAKKEADEVSPKKG